MRKVPKLTWAAWIWVLLAAGRAGALDLAVPYVGADSLQEQGHAGAGVEIGILDLFAADDGHPAVSANHLGSVNFAKGVMWASAHATEVAGAALSQDATCTGAAPQAGWWTGQTTNRGTITSLRTQSVAAETFAHGDGILNGEPVETRELKR